MRVLGFLIFCWGSTAVAQTSSPAPAASVPGYYSDVLPCTQRDNEMTGRAEVTCKGRFLEQKSMRELAILRNTIFARYGWDGFRKEWLRTHFRSQPWFKANPKFSYKLLSEVDKKNAHLIGVHEHSIPEGELNQRKTEILSRYGKESLVSAEDRIELGLIDRSLGNFATDEERRDKAADSAAVQLLKIAELRQLSLRDLRILRNTIYARHGRKFKSKVLQDHFAGMGWYKLDPNFSDRRLTKTDTRNIGLIKTVENEFGGPITDEEHLIEPATDGA